VTTASNGTAQTPDLGVLSGLAPQLAMTFVSMASDIALVIDESGVIRNVAVGADPITGATDGWIGKHWAETVSSDTRRKIELLLSEARAGGVTRRREVNHLGDGGHDVPVAYAAVRLGPDGPVLAVGRDLRAVSAIQQRFIDAQKTMERDYWQQRQTESRYRMLFQVATDGVMMVDALTLSIVEVNRAAAALFHRSVESLIGEPATVGLASTSRAAVDELLVTARTTGRPGALRAIAAPPADTLGAATAVDVSATPFRAGDTMLLLVRARAVDRSPEAGHRFADFVEQTPDAVVITDSQGRVLMSNPAFVELCNEAGGSAGAYGNGVTGLLLADALGDPERVLPEVLSEVRHMGIAEQRKAAVGQDGERAIEIEISAALLAESDQECIGLTLRRIDQRLASLPPSVGELAVALDRLATQLGVVALPELLQEATDLAERHLIDSALARVQGDRQEAANLLGVSTESLWLRMQRHGLDTSGATAGRPPGLLN
jgi:transcriptional regulator PpsR